MPFWVNMMIFSGFFFGGVDGSRDGGLNYCGICGGHSFWDVAKKNACVVSVFVRDNFRLIDFLSVSIELCICDVSR